MKLLWLASWYPNKISPLEGDFIQRHARAVSLYTPLTVIYMSQYGQHIAIEKDTIDVKEEGSLKEIIIYFRFKKTGIHILDKLRYNWKYYSTYRRFIKNHFSRIGKPDIVHVHVPMKAGIIAKWIKRKWGVPYIVSEHSATYVKGAADAFENRSAYFKNAVKSVFQNASLMTSVSQHDGNIIQKKFGLQQWEIVRNVVDTKYFFLADIKKAGRFRFLHISVMNYQKNIEGILRTCQRLKALSTNWEIELIGPMPKEVKALIKAFELEDFVLISGEMTNTTVAVHMQHAAGLVIFSRYENFPCVVIEALCCGMPVIATSVGGIPEAIDSSNGYMVRSEDEDALLLAMKSMMDNYSLFNNEKIAVVSHDRYAYKKIGKQFFEIYQKLM